MTIHNNPREILPITKHEVVYNPFLYRNGYNDKGFFAPGVCVDRNRFNQPYHRNQIIPKNYICSIREAEMIKVSYNTFITAKICIANTIMEMCHKLGINSDTVTDALALGTDRIISAKYLRGGMADGGGCHPRDNIALSWLAQELNLSYDLYGALMTCRDRQTEWLAKVIEAKAKETGLPIVILGKAFKKNVNITTGSPAILLTHFLTMPYKQYDPHENWSMQTSKGFSLVEKAIYFIATNHDVFRQYKFPQGSVVIDPWRYLDNATMKIG